MAINSVIGSYLLADCISKSWIEAYPYVIAPLRPSTNGVTERYLRVLTRDRRRNSNIAKTTRIAMIIGTTYVKDCGLDDGGPALRLEMSLGVSVSSEPMLFVAPRFPSASEQLQAATSTVTLPVRPEPTVA
jgi:hypothetical protein